MLISERYPYIHWDRDNSGYNWPSMRDSEGKLLEPFTSYIEHLLAKEKSAATPPHTAASKIDSTTYSLSALIRFLTENSKSLYRLNDLDIINLRTILLKDIRSNPISRGTSHGTKRTANTKLEHIYQFIYWAQKNRRLPRNTIGRRNCRINSSLPDADERGSELDTKYSNLYPLCFPSVGRASRQDKGQYWATSQDIISLESFFWRNQDFYLAERNTLALRIHQSTAWRKGSVNSLTVDLFSEDALSSQRGMPFCRIAPPKQKGSYEKYFSVDWILIHRIIEYINNGRQTLMDRAGSNEEKSCGHLFIGLHGKPLTDGHYGDIFSDAFKAIGAPKGAGAHSIRRYRTVEEVKSEITRRKNSKLPISRELVALSVKDLLGHASEESGRAYDHVVASIKFDSIDDDFQHRLLASELERDVMKKNIITIIDKLPPSTLECLSNDIKSFIESISKKDNF